MSNIYERWIDSRPVMSPITDLTLEEIIRVQDGRLDFPAVFTGPPITKDKNDSLNPEQRMYPVRTFEVDGKQVTVNMKNYVVINYPDVSLPIRPRGALRKSPEGEARDKAPKPRERDGVSPPDNSAQSRGGEQK